MRPVEGIAIDVVINWAARPYLCCTVKNSTIELVVTTVNERNSAYSDSCGCVWRTNQEAPGSIQPAVAGTTEAVFALEVGQRHDITYRTLFKNKYTHSLATYEQM